MLTRRTVLGAAAGARAMRGQQPKRPNFLFLLADDHAGYVLGCDGNPRARTPNLDRLAAESVRFAHHYCNSPVCTPSRQSFFTGQMPHMAGVTRLPTPLAENKPTLARQLRAAGYRTAVFGKMHFNRQAEPGLHGFETIETEDVIRREWGAAQARPVPEGIGTKPPWRPFKDPARIWLNADKLPFPRYHEDMRATYIARRATRYLEEHHDGQAPFALWVSFMVPHSPFDFPIEDRARFDPADCTPPRVGPEDPPQIPLIFRDLTDQDKRGIIAAYYTSVRFLDHNLGVVLAKLRDLGLDRDTFVVYAADHGYDLGHHGRFEKHCGYDPALRVPLLVRHAGHIRPGIVSDMTEHIDLPATILDMLEVPPLPVTHGRSLRSYLEGRHAASPRDHIFSEYLENEEAYIRTSRHKFVYCTGRRARDDGYRTDRPTPGRYVRLYDLHEDPGEFHDISAREPRLVEKFEDLLLARFRTTHPEASREPKGNRAEALDFYLRPRDV